MNKRRLLYFSFIAATLGIGVVIGTIVSGGAKAGEQKAAPLAIPDPVSLSNAFSQIAAQVGPAVVNITTESVVEAPTRSRGGRGGRQQQPPSDPFGFFDFFGSPDVPEKASGVGSGVIVDRAGYILTNEHVIDKATKITVLLEDKSEYPGKVIGSDTETDLAVVKIDVGHDLTVAKLGNSDPVRVGDWVLAIGSPFNQDHTVTAGIVSAKGRENIGGGTQQFQSFIQTDAAINPGNSGGPLVNMAGEVIGINTAILSETRSFAGLGFALPSNTAIKVYNQLVQNGKVTRGGIGIQYVDDPQLLKALGLKNGDGVVIQDVPAGKPAAKAGIRPGDVILSIDGQKTPNGTALLEIIANEPIGKTVQIKINRDGKEITFPVTVTDRANVVTDQVAGAIQPRGGDTQGVEASLGLHVAPVTPDQARRLGISADGVLVTSVDRGSVAEDAGIGPDWIILRVIAGSQRMDVHNMEDFRNAEKLLKSGSSVAFMVLRPDPRSNGYSNAIIPVQVP